MSSSKSDADENEPEAMVIYEEENYSSSIVPTIGDWSSLEVAIEETNKKRLLHEAGLYSPGSGEICAKIIALSNSEILKHEYYNYTAVKDPGIQEAIFSPEVSVNFSDDGQELYLALCKEMNVCPVRLFHKGLLTPNINLSYYGVNPSGIRPMAMALQYNRFVQVLNLTDNILNDDACYHLGEMLNSNITLEELNMSNCQIGPTGILRLGNNLHVNRTLITLNLAGNKLGEEGGAYYANMIMKGVSVNCLNLSKNSLGRRAALAFAEVFQFIDKITHLDLSLNNLYHSPSIAKMLESLSHSTTLQELNLAWNSLEGKQVAGTIKNLMLVPTLTILNLSNNRLFGEALAIIVEGLFTAKKLVTLDISFNPLSPGDALTALEKMLRPRVKLQNLFMANVWVNKTFHLVLDKIKTMKTRKNFVVTFDGVLGHWTLKDVDARELVLKRADYLGRNGKNKVDVVKYFLTINKENSNINVKDFIDRAAADRIPLDDGLIEELANAFPGRKTAKAKFINLENLCEYMQRIWPDRMVST